MHRDEWDDEDAEPGNFRVALKIQFYEQKFKYFVFTKKIKNKVVTET